MWMIQRLVFTKSLDGVRVFLGFPFSQIGVFICEFWNRHLASEFEPNLESSEL